MVFTTLILKNTQMTILQNYYVTTFEAVKLQIIQNVLTAFFISQMDNRVCVFACTRALPPPFTEIQVKCVLLFDEQGV